MRLACIALGFLLLAGCYYDELIEPPAGSGSRAYRAAPPHSYPPFGERNEFRHQAPPATRPRLDPTPAREEADSPLEARLARLEARLDEMKEILENREEMEALRSAHEELLKKFQNLVKEKERLERRLPVKPASLGPGRVVFRDEVDSIPFFVNTHAGGPPQINGAIVGVSDKVNLVVINVGEEDGVRVGFAFTIYRGNSYVGKMVVEKVYPRQAAGRVMLEMTKSNVRQGDRVKTRVD